MNTINYVMTSTTDITEKGLTLSTPATQSRRHGKRPQLVDTRGSDKIEIDYFRFFESLYRKEITDWQSARTMRRDPFNPITFFIQQLYKDAMLDNHLQGAIENRILRIVNKEFVIKDAEGNIDKKRSPMIQTRWFRTMVKKAMESKFFGYTLLFANNLNSPNRQILELPRENVIPERGVLVKNAFDPNSDAIHFRDFPNFFLYIELGDNAIGTLERIAPMTIFKRHSWASWDEFEQIFGIPIRIARTAIQSDKHRNELQTWLEFMGTASYGIFDKQVDIEFIENQKNDAFRVFYEKIQAINKEISKGIVGQTMTMDDGSSQSQANVHLSIYNEITAADAQDIQDWVTDDLFPILRYWGFDIPEGFYMSIMDKEVSSPKDKIVIDEILMRNGYNIKTDYIEEFYGTPLDEKEPRTNQQSLGMSDVRHPMSDNTALTDFFG
ncbi:MAG: DUF935 domain-containing protein [Lentimicrobiaceae bacterium]|nr:DUF935 domain-containing protein [Lentimicrobiaceae bacterium]